MNALASLGLGLYLAGAYQLPPPPVVSGWQKVAENEWWLWDCGRLVGMTDNREEFWWAWDGGKWLDPVSMRGEPK